MLQDQVQLSLQLLLVNKSWLCERQQTLEPPHSSTTYPSPPPPVLGGCVLTLLRVSGSESLSCLSCTFMVRREARGGEGREEAADTCFTAPVEVPSPALYVLMVIWTLL